MNRSYGSHTVAGGQSHVRTVAGTVGEFFWKWSCRRSSELYSYEGSVLSRFGPHRLRLGGEGPPRDFDLLSRRRHRFFSLRRKSASFADLEKSCEFVFHNFSFFICWAIRHPSFQADGGWLFSVIIDFSVFIRFSAQLSSALGSMEKGSRSC